MHTSELGQTGIQVSPLGLGTVKFGRDQQVKYPWSFKIPDDQAVLELLSLSRDLGINLLDTAPAYGTSEARLGQLLMNRQDWVIVSKVGEAFENGQSHFDFSAHTTRKTIETSLKKLNTDYLDVVLVHSDGDDKRIVEQEDVIETLLTMKQEGLIRAVGLSTKTTEGGLWTVENTDVIMATRNHRDHTDDPVLDRALELNKGVVIKKGLQSGHVDTKAGGGGIEAALNYVFSHQAVNCLIAGTINPEHLIQNAQIVEQLTKSMGSE
ncbi:MAG: aldo/keto reductase [gamma proteobacterium symbiont of Bathyaustriella thionipta]|nr:aldo/keto reductase [gamma proteobacterium symbiont of Bathyaustriella thionipta]MCU7949284.1 aldo/keto reductase [gamma proteobacterium symbiont of Bathyaustriella thionipta]MCU7954002.1 aldo/keto reductase [gamma proteobacterium symbiont of Bathyaustriella thionipta]MCU7955887.1 aldo/keto reductase [gamma proteobacterium symbiont of Bathyaustriella thionipta]MCU7966391.1 aldo/keto reductase [gamma proteobacterium symbiont of Bathyaustriella thionipta]